jgi:hypothetical protein
MLKVLHDALGVTPPRSQQVTPLFNSLVAANEIPSYVDKLIAPASGPRNNMASHGRRWRCDHGSCSQAAEGFANGEIAERLGESSDNDEVALAVCQRTS